MRKGNLKIHQYENSLNFRWLFYEQFFFLIAFIKLFCALTAGNLGTAVSQWLSCCATNRKDAGSIPACVSGFFIDIKYF